MYRPKFKLDSGRRLYNSPKYICDGHWLVDKYALNIPQCPKALQPLESLQIGIYDTGIKSKVDTVTKFPDFSSIIPKRDGYEILDVEPIGIECKNGEIFAFVYQAPNFVIGVQENYAPLLSMGAAFAKDARSPIIVLDSGDLHSGQLLAVVMPVRLTEKPKRADAIHIAAANLIADWDTIEKNTGVILGALSPRFNELKNAVSK